MVNGVNYENDGLIWDLLVRAGMLMEDHSVAAISSLPRDSADRRRRIRTIALAGATIGALALGAWCLNEHAEMSGRAD